MPLYEAKVVVSYFFDVEANSKEEAEKEALENFDELSVEIDVDLVSLEEIAEEVE